MTPLHDSLNSCFSELTGRGDFDAACFPRQHCNPAGQWCTNGDGCVLASAPQQAPVKVQLQGQAVSRLTNALLEANDRIFKFNTTSVSPAETPAASEQLCGPARPLQAGAVEVLSATQQPYTSHIGLCGNQHRAERDISDTASETGSSSTPPPRKGRRRTAMCRNTHTKAAARKLQPPPAPAFRPAQTPFPWARTTTSKLVQRLLAMQAPDRCPSDAFPPCKAARFGARSSPGQQTSCPAALPPCPHAELAADRAMTSCMRADLAAEVGMPACARLPAGMHPELSVEPLDASNAGSLPSGMADWRVQVWPAPPNCTYAGVVPCDV